MPPRNEIAGTITLTILDRLIDNEPKNRALEPAPARNVALRELRASLRRDLEWLLNTRRTPLAADESHPEAQASLYNYGLPDLSSVSVNSYNDQTQLCKHLETAIEHFEPRLMNIVVTMAAAPSGTRTLRFMIEGLLKLDPAPEHVSFDTTLELSSGEYAVKGESGGR